MDTFEYTDSYFPTKSSAICAIRWNAHSFQLAVTFMNGTTVGYHNVSRERFDAFCLAYSAGGYWNDVFRDDRLSFPRIKFKDSQRVEFVPLKVVGGNIEYSADVTLTVNAKFNVKAASFADAEKAVLTDLENLPILKNGTYEIEVRSLNKV